MRATNNTDQRTPARKLVQAVLKQVKWNSKRGLVKRPVHATQYTDGSLRVFILSRGVGRAGNMDLVKQNMTLVEALLPLCSVEYRTSRWRCNSCRNQYRPHHNCPSCSRAIDVIIRFKPEGE